MDIFDLLIPPIYAVFILFFAHKFNTKRKAKEKLYKYFMPGLLLKMFGAVCLGLVYFYYYKGGDTVNYFYTAEALLDTLFERPDDFLYIYFGHPMYSEYYMFSHYFISTNGNSEFTYWVN